MNYHNRFASILMRSVVCVNTLYLHRSKRQNCEKFGRGAGPDLLLSFRGRQPRQRFCCSMLILSKELVRETHNCLTRVLELSQGEGVHGKDGRIQVYSACSSSADGKL